MRSLLPRSILLTVAAVFLLSAQTKTAKPPASPEDGEPPIPTFKTPVNVVVAPTAVMDSRGKVVNGLKPHDFRLFDNDKLQEITEDIGFQPLSIVVCIQDSSQMEDALPKLKKMGPLLKDLVIGQDGEIAILAFDHRIQTVQEFTTDGDRIQEALDKIRLGSTQNRLIDTVDTAAKMLRYKKDRRKVILLASETLDRSSEMGIRDVAILLQFYNIEVYTLNVNRLVGSLKSKPAYPRPSSIPVTSRPIPGIAPTDPTTVAQTVGSPGYAMDFVPVVTEIFRSVKGIFVDNPAEVLTKFTGGREKAFTSQADLEHALSEIGEELHTQYLLSYNPNNKLEGGFHTIRVEVMRPGLKIRTRPGYWMAGVPE
jgi:VWFA-related protein